MPEEPGPLDRRTTGIPGLDDILEGGLLEGGVYIVQGTPGSGKTIFGNQVCFHVASGGGNAVYVTLLAEAHDRMLAHLRRMRFFDPTLVGSRISYLSGFRTLETDGLPGLLKILRGVIADHKAAALVIDGAISAGDTAGNDRQFTKFIHELQVIASLMNTTVLVLSNNGRRQLSEPEGTMVDGIIDLSDDLSDLRTIRRLQIRKLRGSRPLAGRHTLEISDEGLRVYPRIETQLGPRPGERTGPRRRARFGVPRLDAMLGEGLPYASMTLLLGPSGCGKTLLGLQYLAEGARRKEPGLYFGFYERPEALLAKGERIVPGLKEGAENGLLHIRWQPPIEAVIDILGDRLISAVRQHQIQRLVIDGVQGFQLAAEFPRRVRTIFSAFSEELEAAGVTTVYTMETHDLFGPRIEAPLDGLSPITENIILLRHVELRSRLHRLISVLKLRDSHHDSSLCEFEITDQGMVVGERFDADQLLSGSAQPAPRRSARGRAAPRKRKAPKRRS
jgi:circadian clock protein KaiC